MEDYHEDQIAYLKVYVDEWAQTERSFGPATALCRYGKAYAPAPEKPKWLRLGAEKSCFNNATVYAVTRDDVMYVEGYALEPELPLPVHHAWLIDASGRVIDPTWGETKDHSYFGVPFQSTFVRETLEMNGQQAGVLVNLHLLRRHYRQPGALEAALVGGVFR